MWITHDIERPVDADPRRGGGVTRRAGAGLRKLAATAAAVLVASTGPTLVAAAAPVPPTGSVRFLDHHGPVLQAVQLYLIYWGGAWTATAVPSPPPDQITGAMRTVMAGPYLPGLAQYRGVGRGVLRGSAVITKSDPPHRFTDGHVRTFLNGLLDAGTVPGPDADNQTVYGVLMPSGITSRGSGFDGEHDYYTHRGRRIHFMWMAASGNLATATRVLSHEVVESATDPERTGFRGVAGACSQYGACEIADVCSATSVLDGVTVTSYWSNQSGRCVVPVRQYLRPAAHLIALSRREGAPLRLNTSAELVIPATPPDSRRSLGGRRDDAEALRSDAESRIAECGFGIACTVDRWVAERRTSRTISPAERPVSEHSGAVVPAAAATGTSTSAASTGSSARWSSSAWNWRGCWAG